MTNIGKLLIFKLLLLIIMGCNGIKHYPNYLKNRHSQQSNVEQEIQQKKIIPLELNLAEEEQPIQNENIENPETKNDSLLSCSSIHSETEYKEEQSEPNVNPEKQIENSQQYANKKRVSEKDVDQEVDKRVFHPSAKTALILSFFGFTVILGIIAIAQASKALKEIEQNPEKYKGKGMANFAILISVIFIAMSMISVIMMLSDIGGFFGSFF